tara:strand:- start:9408 stop:9623 length:216 start_codon:yes stop_codon:yes gene_type:complete
MIIDMNIGGVLIPGLLVLALLALAATAVTLRLLSATGLAHRFAYPPVVEIATFLIILGLLTQYPPTIGPLP